MLLALVCDLGPIWIGKLYYLIFIT